jgi:carbonic anhydrase
VLVSLADLRYVLFLFLHQCCDSRYDPTLVFNADPGEIFTIRNVANVVPPFVKNEDKKAETAHHGTCAAIEYAVKSLKVEAIVVLGHAQCGGCAHALSLFSPPAAATTTTSNEEEEKNNNNSSDDGSGYVDAWCGLIKESVKHVCAEYDKDERLRQLEHENVRRSVENVKTFPFVQERIAKGELKVRGGFFTIFSGGLSMMDEETKAFKRIKDIELSEEKAPPPAADAAAGVAADAAPAGKEEANPADPPQSAGTNKRQKKK